MLNGDFSQVKFPLVWSHFLWPPSTPVSTTGVVTSSPEWGKRGIFCLFSGSSIYLLPVWKAFCSDCNLLLPLSSPRGLSVLHGSTCSCPLVLVNFGFYNLLPSLVPRCTLRFYLFGLQTTAFFPVVFSISNTCWLCSITWSIQYFVKNCVSGVKTPAVK